VEKDPELQEAKQWQEFSRKQAVIDIKRQLTSAAVNDGISQEVLRREFDMPPKHINLVEKLFT
jgi:hypothetical protein